MSQYDGDKYSAQVRLQCGARVHRKTLTPLSNNLSVEQVEILHEFD
jgi:hypothetical protein